jgi:hypothetical protein
MIEAIFGFENFFEFILFILDSMISRKILSKNIKKLFFNP